MRRSGTASTLQAKPAIKVSKKNKEAVSGSYETNFSLTQKDLKEFLCQAPAAIAILSGPKLVFSFANPLFQRLFKRSEEQLVGKSVREVFPEVEGQGIFELFETIVESGKPFSSPEYQADFDREGDGVIERCYFNFIAQPIKDSNGRVTDIIFHVTEVTKQVKARLEAEQHQEKYRTLFNSIDEGFALVEVLRNKSGKPVDLYIIEVNRAWQRHTGLSGEVAGRTIRTVLPQFEKRWVATLDRVVHTGRSIRIEEYSQSLERWLSIRATKVGSNGHTRLALVLEDISDRKEAEELARASSKRLELIADAMPVLIAYVDNKERYQFNNKNYKSWFGKKNSELHGKTMKEVLGRKAYRLAKPHIDKVLSGKSVTYEALLPYKDGGPRYVLANYIPHRGKDKKVHGFYALVADITQRKKAEHELKDVQERFMQLANSMPQLVWTANSEGRVDYYNARRRDFSGISAKKNGAYDWSPMVHPDDVDKTWKAWQQAVKSGSTYEMEHRLKYKKYGYRWFLSRAAPIKDENGLIIKWYGTATDIEELKQRHEVEKRYKIVSEQRNQLLRLNRTKDEFIALASHQLRTPASAVKQYINMLMDGYAGPVTEQQMQYLTTANESNERQLAIINELLKIAQIDSRGYKVTKKPYDIISLLEDVIGNFTSILELKNQKLIFRSSVTSLMLPIDAPELKLALINLLENASKYSYPNTIIRISVVIKKPYIEVAVADQGVGINKENYIKIFDKFTRVTNDLGDTVAGTGLGLYWVRRIMRLHGGKIRVRSELNKGSTFTLLLPYEKE